MRNLVNRILDAAGEYFAQRKGLLPSVGILLVLINAVLQFIPAGGIVAETNILLHLGVILAIFGIMLAWAL
ncbi:MAG: hypothetical protein JJE12_03755 [Anaerolineales bacterium]|nr:hypothetical protein [Anaerolineales bacterium]